MLFLNLDKIFRAISSSSEKKERSSRSGSSSSLAAVNKDFMFLFFFFSTISREAHLINFISTIVLYTTRDLKFFCQNSFQLFFCTCILPNFFDFDYGDLSTFSDYGDVHSIFSFNGIIWEDHLDQCYPFMEIFSSSETVQ